jgi:hypothetical protein
MLGIVYLTLARPQLSECIDPSRLLCPDSVVNPLHNGVVQSKQHCEVVSYDQACAHLHHSGPRIWWGLPQCARRPLVDRQQDFDSHVTV